MLKLATGREIVLDRLNQSRTYAGMLEGVPNAASNDRHIEAALREAQALSWAKPHLLAPVRRDYLRVPCDMVWARSSARVPEWLPQVTCIAQFQSLQPARDRSKDASFLTVVWFQDELALPIQDSALSALLDLDWDAVASDGDW